MNRTESTLRVPAHCDLHFPRSVLRWDEAIPLGNGSIGCLIYGDGDPLRFGLDRGDLWDCTPAPHVLAPDYTYAELLSLIERGDGRAITDRFDNFYQTVPYPTKLPAGKFQLRYPDAQNVESALSLQRAEATATVKTPKGEGSLHVFIAANKPFGYLKMSGVLPEIELLPHDFTPEDGCGSSSLRRLGYPAANLLQRGSVRGFFQKTPDGGFALLIAEKQTEQGCEAVFTVLSCKGQNALPDEAFAEMERALALGYGAALADHLSYWEQFWNKSGLRIGDETLEKHWYLVQYYLGSCSRKGGLPMPLQGVWTADDGKLPPWKGDYHADANLQFSYYAPLKADRLPEFECLLDYYLPLCETKGKEFARSFFDADGECLPSVFALDGTSLGGWPMYATNLVNHVWMLHVLWEYVRYTGDPEAEMRILERLTEAERTVRRWLRVNGEGKRVLPVSSSPEIFDASLDAWLPELSNNDLALLRFLYRTLAEKKGDSVYAEILASLPDYAVGENGILIHPHLPVHDSHRHFSHLMCAFPMNDWDLSDPEKREILKQSVQTLCDYGSDYWVGFSFCWLADLYGRLGDGEKAALRLRQFTDCLCSQNGFHLNGDFKAVGLTKYRYRPFTLESNMMLAEALQEMLLQCHDGVIRIFPAVPEEWLSDCAFDGLLAYGNIKVSARAENGRTVRVTLHARRDAAVRLLNPFTGEIDSFPLRRGETRVLTEKDR